MIPDMKFYIGLVLAVVLAVVVSLFAGEYRSGQEAKMVADQQVRTMQSTSAGVSEGLRIDEFQAGFNMAQQANRNAFQQSKNEAIAREPETAARATRTVPDSVRNAYRARRIARERSGCVGVECQQDDSTSVAAER